MTGTNLKQVNDAKIPQDLISMPSQYFASPNELLSCEDLNKDQKLRALSSWKQTCIQLQESDEEGMTGVNEMRLSQVNAAIGRLEDH